MKPFAIVFPGQGSQAVGMLEAWGDHPAVQDVLKESTEALGEDVAKLIKEEYAARDAGGWRGGISRLDC
jgi:[acyl-carrier-protein] S-malonyltransferase